MSLTTERNPALQRILHETEQLIREKGCQGTTLKKIMSRTNLSKGAIYHYFKSKDELFGWILKEKVERTNQKFWETVNPEAPELEKPLQAIAYGMDSTSKEQDITNSIFVYFLGKKDDSTVNQILRDYYVYSEQKASEWIQAGQKKGVITEQINSEKTAALFITFSYGLRTLAIVAPEQVTPTLKDFYQLMASTLRGK